MRDGKKIHEMFHRYIWKLTHVNIPDGYEIDHKCRNRKCCNIEHLQLLSIPQHKSKTNRERYAERTELILFALSQGFRKIDLSKMFELNYHTILKISKKELWKTTT